MDCLCLTTRRAARNLTAIYEDELARCGVTPSQFGLLSVLSARPGLSQQHLASAAGLDQTTLSRNLRLLISSGWVTGSRSKTDRRETLYSVTHAGTLRQREAKKIWEQVQKRMKQRLGADWGAAFVLLERLSSLAATEA